nr:unknown Function [uncultured bacterium]
MKSKTSAWAMAGLISVLGLYIMLFVMIGLSIWQGWFKVSIAQLPLLFWIAYAITISCWIGTILLILRVGPSKESKGRLDIFTFCILALGASIGLPSLIFNMKWIEADFLYMTGAFLFVVQMLVSLGRQLLRKQSTQPAPFKHRSG